NMTKDHVAETVDEMHRVIVPEGIDLIVNDIKVEARVPIHEFECSLPTWKETSDGFRQTERRTTVRVYEPLVGRESTIFELGIPVVSIDSTFDVDVLQKVPLNMDRDNVTPAYLRKIRAEVANAMAERLTPDDASRVWVTEAILARETKVETVARIVDTRFGEKAVAYDPSDPESNKIAASQGYTVVHGGTFSRDGWSKIREAGKLERAGAVTPSWRLETSPDGRDPKIDPAEWTRGMRIVADYARKLGEFLLGRSISVTVVRYDLGEQVLAHYARGGQLTFNVTKLGHRFFNERDQAKIDALLIHEFAHEYESDHFDHRYLDAACDLGAKMRHCAITVD
ncbi:MAG: hypothetical protein Q8K63_12465, partial [Acidimicrobiales bacterium]|nr:hypothetical protein [Acidimicrobiales bacterium]